MIKIDRTILKNFIDYADEHDDVEVCGLMTGSLKEMVANELFLIQNVSGGIQAVDYVMNPQQMFDVMKETTLLNKGATKDLVVICHTHPTGKPIPSSIDLNRAEWEIVYLIYSPLYRKTRCWLYKNGEFTEKIIQVI